MKLIFLAWCFFILCPLSVGLRGTSRSQHEYLNFSKPTMQGQVQGLNGNITGLILHRGGGGGERGTAENTGKHKIYFSAKKQKGKGAYGGADIVHRSKHRKSGGASILSSKASLFVTIAMMLYASFAFILIFPSLSF